MIKLLVSISILMMSLIVNAGNGSGTMSFVNSFANDRGERIFDNQVLVKFLSEKASEIKFGVASKENGAWTTEVHSLRPEEFSPDSKSVLEAISASKIQSGNWIKATE